MTKHRTRKKPGSTRTNWFLCCVQDTSSEPNATSVERDETNHTTEEMDYVVEKLAIKKVPVCLYSKPTILQGIRPLDTEDKEVSVLAPKLSTVTFSSYYKLEPHLDIENVGRETNVTHDQDGKLVNSDYNAYKPEASCTPLITRYVSEKEIASQVISQNCTKPENNKFITVVPKDSEKVINIDILAHSTKQSSAELPKQSKCSQNRLPSKKKIPSDINETIQALGTAQPRLSRIPLKNTKQTKEDDQGKITRSDMNYKDTTNGMNTKAGTSIDIFFPKNQPKEEHDKKREDCIGLLYLKPSINCDLISKCSCCSCDFGSTSSQDSRLKNFSTVTENYNFFPPSASPQVADSYSDIPIPYNELDFIKQSSTEESLRSQHTEQLTKVLLLHNCGSMSETDSADLNGRKIQQVESEAQTDSSRLMRSTQPYKWKIVIKRHSKSK